MAKDGTATEGKDPDDLGQLPDVNVDERLAKLITDYQALQSNIEEERKASAGKDKKISSLKVEVDELRKSTLSKEELVKYQEEQLVKEKAEWEVTIREREERAEKQEKRITLYEVLRKPGLEDFPKLLIDSIQGNTAEEMEIHARKLQDLILKERDKRENANKVGPKPQTADGKPINTPLLSDYARWTEEQRRRWADKASLEEREAMLKEISES